MEEKQQFVLDYVEKQHKKVCPDKLALALKIAESMPDDIFEIMKSCEIVGLNERVTYHKFWKKEIDPYTHIFDNETVLLKHKKYPLLIIYGPKIEYIDGYIHN
jgi:hypothetical protein